MIAMLLNVMMTLTLAAQQPPEDMRKLLETVLDQPAQLSLRDVKLTELIETLDRETGVAVRMSPETMALLPYGPQTTFTQAEFGQVSLRQGLTGLFAGLGMRIEVRRDHVEVVPTQALLGIGRKATWADLDTLAQVSALQPGARDADREGLRSRLQFQVPQPGAWELLASQMKDVGAGTGDQVLDIACAKLGWSWFPSEANIVVLPVQARFERQLQHIVTVRRRTRPFVQALDEIARQCGLPVHVEPSALAALTPGTRQNFLFGVEGYSAGDALAAIASQARLTYVITEEGVVFYDPANGRLAAPAPQPDSGAPGMTLATAAQGTIQAAPSGDDAIIGMVPMTIAPGQVMHVLIRASDLPPDLREEVLRRKAEAIEALRKAMGRP